MRFARSLAPLIPANTIFVPGMYFFGFSKYSNRVSFDQVIPVKFRRFEVSYYETHLLRIKQILRMTFGDIGLRVFVSGSLPRFTTNYTIQIRTHFVATIFVTNMTLLTFLFEHLDK